MKNRFFEQFIRNNEIFTELYILLSKFILADEYSVCQIIFHTTLIGSIGNRWRLISGYRVA